MSPEPEKYPSTDDSAESLKHRPTSPINRNWNWSPRAPGSHHVIESVDYHGDNHPLHAPYETVEPSKKMLETQSKDIDVASDDELTDEMKDKISKEKGFRSWQAYMNSRNKMTENLFAAMINASDTYMSAEKLHKRMG